MVSLAAPVPKVAASQQVASAELLAEIQLIKRLLVEQDRRISELEKTIATLRQANPPSGPIARQSPPQSSSGSTVQLGSLPWMVPSNWDRVKRGMSESQVRGVLGAPVSVDAFTGRKLFYKGEVPGSGSVTGYVWLIDDRVISIEKPVF